MSDEFDETEEGCEHCNGKQAEQVPEANDMLLNLTGEIAKLGIVLAEIPECQVKGVLGRLSAFLECVDALPIKISKLH